MDFAKLSLSYMNTRHRFLPPVIARRIMPPPNYSPPYDTTHIIDTHLAAIEDFVRTAWESTGRSRDDIFVFFSPTTTDLLENRHNPNADLVRLLAAMHIRAYDLQQEYYQATVARGQRVDDYFFDTVHYLQPGHALAGRTVATYLLRNGLAAP